MTWRLIALLGAAQAAAFQGVGGLLSGDRSTLVSAIAGIVVVAPFIAGIVIWFGKDYLKFRREYPAHRESDSKGFGQAVYAAAERLESLVGRLHAENKDRFDKIENRLDPIYYLVMGERGRGGYAEEREHRSQTDHSHGDHLLALTDWAERMGEKEGVPYRPPRADIRPRRRDDAGDG